MPSYRTRPPQDRVSDVITLEEDEPKVWGIRKVNPRNPSCSWCDREAVTKLTDKLIDHDDYACGDHVLRWGGHYDKITILPISG